MKRYFTLEDLNLYEGFRHSYVNAQSIEKTSINDDRLYNPSNVKIIITDYDDDVIAVITDLIRPTKWNLINHDDLLPYFKKYNQSSLFKGNESVMLVGTSHNFGIKRIYGYIGDIKIDRTYRKWEDDIKHAQRIITAIGFYIDTASENYVEQIINDFVETMSYKDRVEYEVSKMSKTLHE